MARVDNEILDTQIIAENIGFLDSCFDNSFSLHSSLITVKEYVAEQHAEGAHQTKSVDKSVRKNRWSDIHNRSITFDSSICNNTQTIISNSENINVTNKNLKDWGLPYEIAKKYEQRGITDMFDWQVKCLSNSKVLRDCCNLVYSAPTSAGKTLVAEILTIKTILERQKKVIIILPFVSIVREKMFYLQDILSSSGIRVEGFMGAQSPPGGLQAVHVAICTIEKANSLINHLLDDNSISELGAVIVDELHLLGDPHRGYILELLLTKIKYVSSKSDDVKIQVVGMSATLPNLEDLASWLDAELFITQFRPIPLDEYCLIGNNYFDKHGNFVNKIDDGEGINKDIDNVLKICLDTIKDGCSILIFCMTKNRCENLAQTISSSFYKMGCTANNLFGSVLREQLKQEGILEVLEQLKNCPVGLDQILKNTISFGVAYHHAGLTFDERDIIEGGFKSGAIRVLVATSTLSSGVNLPARKVIVRTPVFLKQPINILTYKQMIGRAGRMGKDIKGESILICTEAEKKIGFDLMMGTLDPVNSCIENEDKYMRAILEMIASQVACTKQELNLYSACTLLFTQQNKSPSQNSLLEKTLNELRNYELIRIQTDKDETCYVATHLGKACLSSSMAPNDGLSLFCELQKARQCLVLETDLHLIYLVTPYSVSSQWGDIDWLHLLTLWESLTKAMKRVGDLVGVQESFIIRCLRGNNKMSNIQNKLNIHKRFYTALALQDLVNEVPLSDVASKFQCARGFLQSLQQAAATFAGMVTSFCRQLGWKNMEMLISQFQDRLHFGIHSELIELMKLPSLNGTRARTLYNAGLDTISRIASANVNEVENSLLKAVPFQSEKEREGEDKVDTRKRNKIKNIWITGNCAMTVREAAENLVLEARKFLELEIGVAEIKWSNKTLQNTNVTVNFNKEQLNPNTECNINATDVKKEPLSFCQSGVVTKESFVDKLTKLKPCVTENNSEFEKSENMPCDSTIGQKIGHDYIIKEKIKVAADISSHTSSCSNTLVTVKEVTQIKVDSQNKTNGDDVVWDSLNFTEAAIVDLTKVTVANKISSPNISFKDQDDKNVYNKIALSNSHLTEDVSLFSSDGDNSSLFEDSLPLDLISSNLLDSKCNIVQNPQSKLPSDNCSGINTSTFLNEFQNTAIEIEDEEDIKLIYDDENISSENELLNKCVESEVVEVINTQEIKLMQMNSPYKRRANYNNISNPSKAKRVKSEPISISFQKSKACRNNKVTLPNLRNSKSKTFLSDINNVKINCFVLSESDIIENFHIIENLQVVSIYLDTSKSITTDNDVIGSNILKKNNSCHKISGKSTVTIKGIAIHGGYQNCYYLDISSVHINSNLKQKLTQWLQKKTVKYKMMSLKSNCVYLKQSFGITMSAPCLDISLAEWLTDSDEKIPNIQDLVKRYCNMDLITCPMKINNKEKKFKSLDVVEEACVVAWLLWEIAARQEHCLLEKYQSLRHVIDIEIQVSKILANSEYCGITVDKELASQLLFDVRSSQDTLQKKAYKICGYHFNFNSSKDVAKALGIYRGRKVSTKKSVLTAHNTPISSVIIFWRKLNSILTKTLYPLTEKACIYSDGDRMKPSYTMYTCTGRISMHEPNLQNVPRTFSIPIRYLTAADAASSSADGAVEFNCRNIFKAAPGHVLVSADYCQLEMRILTHYSKDDVLTNIMSSGTDVFKSVAASWGGVPEDEVDDDLRQKAKQLCYGILYGMGNKTLSQHLDVSEMEAAVFMDTFYKTYPSIRAYTQAVVQECRAKGYVETLMSRRRYLPDINSTITSRKCTAERQAVNTTIQGSAADIAKAAMCAIDQRTDSDNKPQLILQMHDELIYEVPETSLKGFIRIIREEMENTVRLRVPLPVRVKWGHKWGSLKEIELEGANSIGE